MWYFDGVSGWEILPDKRVLDLAGGELDFARKYLADFELNVWLADRLPDYEVSSPQPDVLRIVNRRFDHSALDIVLDPSSWLPLKELSTSLADPAHPVASETRIGGWMAAAGVRFPSRVENFHAGVRLAEMTSASIICNSGLQKADLAAKPADLQPVFPVR